MAPSTEVESIDEVADLPKQKTSYAQILKEDNFKTLFRDQKELQRKENEKKAVPITEVQEERAKRRLEAKEKKKRAHEAVTEKIDTNQNNLNNEKVGEYVSENFSLDEVEKEGEEAVTEQDLA